MTETSERLLGNPPMLRMRVENDDRYYLYGYSAKLNMQQLNKWEAYIQKHLSFTELKLIEGDREVLLAGAANGNMEKVRQCTREVNREIIKLKRELFGVARKWCEDNLQIGDGNDQES